MGRYCGYVDRETGKYRRGGEAGRCILKDRDGTCFAWIARRKGRSERLK